jgi:lysophospholipase L1-like esterase
MTTHPLSDHAVVHAVEAADPHCIGLEAATTALSAQPWRRYAVLGDSVTAGVMAPVPGYQKRSFPDRLRIALGATRPGFAATNLAEPYLTAAEIREQQLGPALEFRPDLVLVSAGANDAFSRSYDSARVRDELAALLTPLADAGALVVTVGLFDLARTGLVPDEVAGPLAARFDDLDRVTAELTPTLGGVHLPTHHHPLAASPEIFSGDRIHANARGHAIAFAATVEALAAVER